MRIYAIFWLKTPNVEKCRNPALIFPVDLWRETIIGVLSVSGIAGYSKAMQKFKQNKWLALLLFNNET